MEPEVTQAALEGTAPAHDLSIIGLILHADIIVQTVLLLLVLASLWSWAIIFDKIGRYRKVSAEADTFEDEFWSGRSLEELYDRLQGRASHPMALLFLVAMREWQRSIGKTNVVTSGARLQERIAQVMRLTLNREVERLERYLGFLATVGSTAPFIGLFGTVWGIMNSFQAIGASSDTSLAVVAPGIAEALFATAVGLVAAIPAVIAYNKFAADMERFANRLEGFVDEFNTILSRQIDEGQA
jgi:biopolymer transport protein TolQ